MPAETATTPFSYRCGACGRCCYGKRIQANPYEVLRLARNRGLTTGDFIARYLDSDGPFLKVREDGACVFLEGTGCGVHSDRPLVCRTYPLGRIVDGDGNESFVRLAGHPESQSVLGTAGTIADYLRSQDAGDHIAAGDLLQQLFYRYFDALQQLSRAELEAVPLIQSAAEGSDTGRPFYAEWFDVDAIAADTCSRRGTRVPARIDENFDVYLEAMETWLENMKETLDEYDLELEV